MVTRGKNFAEFVRGSATRLLRTAVLLTGDRQAAEDLVQETYERIYVPWPRIRSGCRQFVVPYDDFAFPYFKIQDPGKPNFLYVVVDMGKRLGWGLTKDKLTPFVFKDGVAVAEIPVGLSGKLTVDRLPAR